MSFDEERIVSAIESALRLNSDLDETAVCDVAFHMTDWLSDLEAYTRFCSDPSSLSRRATADLIMGFLIHVPAHVTAAARLHSGQPVTDVFGIGAVQGDGMPHV